MYVIVSIYMIHVTIRVAHDLRKSNHPLKCATTELSSSDKSMVLLDLLIFGNQENVFCVQLIVGMLHTFHFAGLCLVYFLLLGLAVLLNRKERE